MRRRLCIAVRRAAAKETPLPWEGKRRSLRAGKGTALAKG